MFESCWEATLPADPEARHPLRGDVKTEALIIGGGLVGILCAYRLKERGIDCIVLEGRRAGSGVTGHTTGKVTAQHGLVYGSLLRSLGQERAALCFALHQEAVQDLRKLAAGVLCDFEDKTAYTVCFRRRSLSSRNPIQPIPTKLTPISAISAPMGKPSPV